jgi:helicase
MPKVIKINDNPSLAKTSDYPYAKWSNFTEFNPVQTRLMETYEGDSNIAIAAATSAGKTVCSEMYLAYEIRKRGGKGIYVGPLKALAKEKEQDWTADTHHFHDLNISIATGDHRLTMKRIKEMDESNLVVMTPEMLASRCRNHKSDKSRFLYEVGTVVFDESHLLTVPKRGDHIEVALMKLAEINPDIRIVLLSATMPNVDEICGWTSNLTGRDTYYLESDYRPCPLNIHYETYYDGDKGYWEKEAAKVGTACAICEYYPDDKFLIFYLNLPSGGTIVLVLLAIFVLILLEQVLVKRLSKSA